MVKKPAHEPFVVWRVKNKTPDKMPGRTNQPPYRGRMVLVLCEGVRPLANKDRSGKWGTISRRKELRGFVEVIRVVE